MFKYQLITLIAGALVCSVGVQAQGTCADILSHAQESKKYSNVDIYDIKEHQERIKSNGFTLHRSLTKGRSNSDPSYFDAFGSGFKSNLLRLKKSDHWADMGTGDGNAIYEYKTIFNGKAKTTGVVVEKTKVFIQRELDLSSPSSVWLSGRYVEAIPTKEIGQADIITDYYGPMTYTLEPMSVLKKYVEMLKPGGSIYIRFGNGGGTVYLPNRSENIYGKTLNLPDYLARLPGLKIRKVSHGIEIIVDDKSQVENWPHLELSYLYPGRPPDRSFKVENQKLNENTQVHEIQKTKISDTAITELQLNLSLYNNNNGFPYTDFYLNGQLNLDMDSDAKKDNSFYLADVVSNGLYKEVLADVKKLISKSRKKLRGFKPKVALLRYYHKDSESIYWHTDLNNTVTLSLAGVSTSLRDYNVSFKTGVLIPKGIEHAIPQSREGRLILIIAD